MNSAANQHPTVAQNAAHRNDIAWEKSKGKSFTAETPRGTERFTSEYLNHFTDQAIRKSWRMTGRDWWVFEADGTVTERCATLTLAKWRAANPLPTR